MIKRFFLKPKKTRLAKKRASWRQGIFAEWVAIAYLWLKGWQILHHRCKTPVGEVDVIARKGTTIAFIEVKFRRRKKDLDYVVSPHQWRRIERASHFLAHRFPAHYTLRLDMILLSNWAWPDHQENAFP
jgi:putative endonuclease